MHKDISDSACIIFLMNAYSPVEADFMEKELF